LLCREENQSILKAASKHGHSQEMPYLEHCIIFLTEKSEQFASKRKLQANNPESPFAVIL
jgi:hypothetical protein